MNQIEKNKPLKIQENTKKGIYWRGVNACEKEMGLSEFSIFMDFHLRTGPSCHPQSYWLEKPEDRVWNNYNSWKVGGHPKRKSQEGEESGRRPNSVYKLPIFPADT